MHSSALLRTVESHLAERTNGESIGTSRTRGSAQKSVAVALVILDIRKLEGLKLSCSDLTALGFGLSFV